MHKRLLLVLLVAACGKGDAGNGVGLPADESPASASRSNAVTKTEIDGLTHYAPANSGERIEGKPARDLIAKTPLPAPADAAVSMLYLAADQGTLGYTTKLSVTQVGEHYKKAFTTNGMKVVAQMTVEGSPDESLNLSAQSDKLDIGATIGLETDGTTAVMLMWTPRKQ